MKIETRLEMGLGEAIVRHNLLHKMITSGIATIEQKKEYDLITEAMNNLRLDLGFDCNGDGIPDDIQIFSESAKTSCCRLNTTQSRNNSSNRKELKQRGSR